MTGLHTVPDAATSATSSSTPSEVPALPFVGAAQALPFVVAAPAVDAQTDAIDALFSDPRPTG